ncbi:hypothetical protein B0H66DRAFT_604713 [Apodospora peruviana]|uniref:Uncharacterized protein n=1 Tax=Apodospora peruviana TaxID=516989 RepID=A0AAE0I0Z7_9PEZI|nr:hypothetical protein B0H66DRAFT_604713 [Apodospora peruviana]
MVNGPKASSLRRSVERGAGDGDDNDVRAALDVMKHFKKPRGSNSPQEGKIEVLLPTGRGSMVSNRIEDEVEVNANETRAGSPVLNNPPGSNSIHSDDHSLPGELEAKASGRPTRSDTIPESPQQPPQSSSAVLHDDLVLADGGQEDDGQEEEDDIDSEHDSSHESQYVDAEMGSPELGSDLPQSRPRSTIHDGPEAETPSRIARVPTVRRSNIYDVPEAEPPTPTRRVPTVSTINGLKGVQRVPKQSYIEPSRTLGSSPGPSTHIPAPTGRTSTARPSMQHQQPFKSINYDLPGGEIEDDEMGADGVGDDEDVFGDHEDHQVRSPGTHSRISDAKSSLLGEATARTQPHYTAKLSSVILYKLLTLMGKSGWTKLGKSWQKRLFEDPYQEDGQADTPAITKAGVLVFKSLFFMEAKLKHAPTELDDQDEWLRVNQESLKKAFDEIQKIVVSICEDRLAVLGDSDGGSSNNLQRRRAMVRDLISCIIPMLILVLESAFFLGGFEEDDDGRTLPVEGTFTKTILLYLLRITGWLLRLNDILNHELIIRPFKNNNITLVSFSKQPKNTEGCDKNRLRLGVLLNDWKDQLNVALRELEEKIHGEGRRRERRQREIARQEARRQAEQAEQAEKDKQNAACIASTHEIARQERPMAAKWRKGTAARRNSGFFSSSPSAPTHGGQLERRNTSLGSWRNGDGGAPSHGGQHDRPTSALGSWWSGNGRAAADTAAAIAPARSSSQHYPRSQQNTARPASRARPALRYFDSDDDDDDDDDEHKVQQAAQPLATRYPQAAAWPHEAKEWLLTELRRLDRVANEEDFEVFAEQLDYPVEEVRQAAEMLRVASKMVSCRHGSTEFEKWARK